MNLDTVDPELILARGRYATCNGAYKDVMSAIQVETQTACDCLRHGLQEADVQRAIGYFESAEKISAALKIAIRDAAELKTQKDELYRAAWGK
jgi:hypothetical protein